MENKVDKYNYGIDLLKIFSMMTIIILHILSHGGVVKQTLDSAHYIIFWGIELFCFFGVDCFAIITGFVSYKNHNYKYSFNNYINLWIQVVFYSLGISLLFMVCNPNSIGLSDLVHGMMPVTFNMYWYFSAYTGMYFVKPFIDCIVTKMDKRLLIKAGICCCLVFSVFGLLGTRYGNPFSINDGYSMVWLCFMYFIGAVIKKYELYKKISLKNSALIILGSYAFLLIWFLFIGKIIGHGADDLFVSYISPAVLGMAVGFVLLFSKLKFKTMAKKCIKFISPAVFGIYLIHEQSLFSKHFIVNNFITLCNHSVLLVPFEIAGIMLSIFFACMVIDKLRIQLFKLLHVKQFAIFIDTKINLVLDKMVEKI